MLQRASEMKGSSIGASDGPIGSIQDLLFDDKTWLVRWLVVDTGHILPGHKVLLPPSILGAVNHIDHQFSVRLTRAEVKASPGVETDQAVSRRMEADTYSYYGWSPYWNTGFYYGGYGYAGALAGRPLSLGRAALDHEHDALEGGDRHLRSVNEVHGYDIAASDGRIGHVADVLVEDGDWGIRYLVVDTRHGWDGAKVLISPRSVDSIDWLQRAVTLDVTREAVKNSPAYGAESLVDRLYEAQFHDYYTRLPESDHERPRLVPAR
jgi:sporulation protein YlmC with PRC-barrel domain